MSGKLPDFESVDFESADVTKEDARVDSFEAKLDEESQHQQVAALQQQAVHEAVAQCLGACLTYLDTLYLQRDAEPCSEIALAHNSWQQEAEPEPCCRDAWLRGALPETVLPARAPVPPTSAQAAARSSAGNEQRARPGSGLMSHSRKGPGLVASSAAADDAQHRPQSKAQQSRRTSIAQSVQSLRPDSARPASSSHPGSGSSTALRPASGTAGNNSTPPAAAAAAAGAGCSPTACTQAAGDGRSNTAASSSPGVAEAASAPAASAAPVSTQRKPASKASKLTPDHQEAEERLRQELQLRRQQEAVVKELKQKDEAARAALLNMQKNLKDKDYTYDGRGKVVPLAKVNPEALPAPPGPQFKVQLNTSAAGAAGAGADTVAAAAAGSAAAGKQAASSSKSTAAANSSSSQPAGAATANTGTAAAAAKSSGAKDAAGAGSPFYVEQASRTQPPVLQSIKPSAGVTLKVGGAAKQGPKREASAQQQTRTQFQQQAKTLNMQTAKAAAGASLGALGSASRHSNSRVSSAAGMHSSSSGGGSSSSFGVCSVPGSARSGRGDSAEARGSSAGRSASGAAAAAAAAGVSAGAAEAPAGQAGSMLAGPTAAGSVSQGAQGRTGASAGAGVIKAGRASAGDCSSGPDINLLLVNAPDWGVASGGGPCAVGQVVDVAKPNDRQLQEEFGRTTHLPKTRAPVATLKTPKTQPNSTSRLSQLT